MDENELRLNDVNFPTAFVARYRHFLSDKNFQDGLFKQQRILAHYLGERNVRGILGYHDTGSGKTRAAIGAAMALNRPTIIECSTTARFAFIRDFGIMTGVIGEKDEVSEEDEKRIAEIMEGQDFIFASLTASNKYDQLYRSAFDLSPSVNPRKNVLEGKTVIVDEVHKMSSFMVSGHSKDGIKMYRLMKNAYDIKFIFLTATPIVNDPFEIVPIFNILTGEEVLPESYEEFQRLFVGSETVSVPSSSDSKKLVEIEVPTLINEETLSERMVGLVSYYPGNKTATKGGENKGFPELKTQYNYVEMSKKQWESFEEIRSKEVSSEFGSSGKSGRSKLMLGDQSQKQTVGSYMVKSRMACNFILPAEIVKKTDLTEHDVDKAFEGVDPTYFTKDSILGTFSPKIRDIVKDIEKKKTEKQMVYSAFTNFGGLRLVELVLKSRGWTKFNDLFASGKKRDLSSDEKEDGGKFKSSSVKKGMTFAVWDGTVNRKMRAKIKNIFNSVDNSHGANIRVIFISPAAAESLDLKAVRIIHILEPFWNMTRILQVMGRAVRFNSHISLPVSEQKVLVKIYIAIPPKKTKAEKEEASERKSERITTDVLVKRTAIRKQKLVKETTKVLKSAAIDCPFFRKKGANYDCLTCVPLSVPGEAVKPVWENARDGSFVPGGGKCVIPLALPIRKMKKLKRKADGLDLYKFQGKTYYRLPFIDPPRFIEVQKQ